MNDQTLLDIWCALNSSFGGPFLALVTIGGFLAVGRSLLAFPTRNSDSNVTERNRKNRCRRWVLAMGIITATFLVANVMLYVIATGATRNGALLCIAPPLSESSRRALITFYSGTAVTAIVGVVYSLLLARLHRLFK